MELTDFNPYVRYIGRVIRDKNYEEPLLAYDHRLFYVYKGAFSMEFQDQTLFVPEDSLLIFPPAVPYRLVFQEAAEYCIVNFDFQCTALSSTSRTPEPENQFQPALIFSACHFPPFDRIMLIEQCGFAAEPIQEIEMQHDPADPFAAMLCSGILKTLLSRAAQQYIRAEKPPSNPIVTQAKTYIARHFTENLTNIQIARQLGYHPYYLNSLFQKCEGMTLHDCLTQTRLLYAKKLLNNSSHSVAEVAYLCGYASAAYFSEVFLSKTGLTPTGYRKLSR